ncbi:hypothetical protein MMMB2_4993 [Mycobacterium marinum MB2]|uniref:hypothetical protein n=1 Tax=Mycobacterium marinum TaxID=1781 RepID=UPI000358CD13|nr:hypothetical protein [Mycobacterium marinum]EPQ71159.1 hypothetical protein MMMB2_4993 [Mycobacterium marinum MB2]
MLTPTLDLGATADGGTLRRTGADDDGLRYRVEVVAASVIDVVQAAGGWLCDRVMAGWQVRVLVPGGDDIRPLQILGATAMDLEAGLTGRAPMGHSLAVGAAAFAADERVRAKLTEALQCRWTEVALWGQGVAAGGSSRDRPGATRAQCRGTGVQKAGANGGRNSLRLCCFRRAATRRHGVVGLAGEPGEPEEPEGR